MPNLTNVAYAFSWSLFCLFALQTVPAHAMQESARSLGESGNEGKFLTPGEVDTWEFEAKDNQVVIASVNTNQFDAVLGMSRVGPDDTEDEVLFSVDLDGSNSRFRYRIEQAGRYKIRVHGYEMKGGGNYHLSVQHFVTSPIQAGTAIRAHTDTGEASFFFDAEPGQFLTFVGSGNTTLYDPDGDIVAPTWGTAYLISKSGEHHVQTFVAAGRPFDFEVRPSIDQILDSGDSQAFVARPNELRTWVIDAEKGQCQLVTVSRETALQSRLILAPGQTGIKWDRDPEIQFLPVARKGEFTTYAAVFGRSAKYFLQTLCSEESNATVAMSELGPLLNESGVVTGTLPVGGARYYRFDGTAGDAVRMKVASETFDTVLRVFDPTGSSVVENDDFGESRNSEASYLIPKSGRYIMQVVSLGDGGGGQYQIDFKEVPKKRLAVGEQKSGSVEAGKSEFWLLNGQQGKPVYVSVRSRNMTPSVTIYSSNATQLSTGHAGIEHSYRLLPVTIGNDGTLMIEVKSDSGRSGDYEVRVLDAAWEE